MVLKLLFKDLVFEIIVQRSGFLNDCSKILSIFSMYSYSFAHLLSWSFIIKSHKLNFATYHIFYGETKCQFFVINIDPKLSNIQNTNKLLFPNSFPQTFLRIHTPIHTGKSGPDDPANATKAQYLGCWGGAGLARQAWVRQHVARLTFNDARPPSRNQDLS